MAKLRIELNAEFWNLNVRAQKHGGGEDDPEVWVGASDLGMKLELDPAASAGLLLDLGFDESGEQGDAGLAVGFVIRRGIELPIIGDQYTFDDHKVVLRNVANNEQVTLPLVSVNNFKMKRTKDGKSIEWKLRVQGEIAPDNVAWLYQNQRAYFSIEVVPPKVIDPDSQGDAFADSTDEDSSDDS